MILLQIIVNLIFGRWMSKNVQVCLAICLMDACPGHVVHDKARPVKRGGGSSPPAIVGPIDSSLSDCWSMSSLRASCFRIGAIARLEQECFGKSVFNTVKGLSGHRFPSYRIVIVYLLPTTSICILRSGDEVIGLNKRFVSCERHGFRRDRPRPKKIYICFVMTAGLGFADAINQRV